MDALVGMSGGMMARLAFAIGSGTLLAAWLWAARGGVESRSGPWFRSTAIALSVFWSAAWLAIAMARLSYPFEMEWCGGAMRDMAARALHGQSLYVAPGSGWFPYEYPPFYLWASALLMRIMGGAESFVPMRLISVVSTLGSAALLFLWVRRLAGSRAWALIAAGLFLASYRFTGAWYDVERLDMLFLVLSLAGIVMLQRAVDRDSWQWAAAAASAHLLAFLTKQQGVLFIAGGVAALAWQRKWKLAGAYGLLSATLCLMSAAALNAFTDGWFGYYCFRVPMANGIRANLAAIYLLNDLPLFAPMIAVLVLAAAARAERRRGDAVLWAMTAMGVIGSLLSRAHWGGDQNVLITGYVFIGAAACVSAGRFGRSNPGVRAPLFALAVAQLLTLAYRPVAQIPTLAGRQAAERYAGLIRSLEREGPVLSLDHGGFTSTRRFHLMGLLDVMHTEKGLPAPLLESVRAHAYAAIVMDAAPETGGYLGELAKHYSRIENVGITTTWTVTGFPTPSPARSVWVLRP